MFEVGNIAARLSGIFQDDGFKKFGKSYDDSAAKARRPVQAKLGADVDNRGFDDANARVAAFGARQAQATLSVGDRDAYDKIARLEAAITIVQHEIERGKEFDIDTGTAEAKLALLQARLKSMQRDLATGQLRGDVESLGLSIEDLGLKAEGAAGGAGGAGGEAGGLGALTESFGPLQGAIAALAPVLLGLGGTLAALAGSGGAAAAGAGVLGIGSFGALAVGVGSVMGVVKPMATEFKNVDKAMKAYQTTVDKFGPKSKEAAAAQKLLNQQIKANGGKEIEQVIKRVDSLGTAWKKVTQPAQQSAIHLINSTLGTAQHILPSVDRDVNENVSALSQGLQGGVQTLLSGGLRGDLKSLSDTFSTNIGTGIHAFADGLLALGNIAKTAAPYVTEFVKGIDHLATDFKRGTDDKPQLAKTVDGLMGQLKSWMGLLKAVGTALFDFFSAGAGQGQGMVDKLTGIVNQWDHWMKSVKGQKALHDFFQDSARITSDFLKVLGPLVLALGTLVRNLMPAWDEVLIKLRPHVQIIYEIVKLLSGVMRAGWVKDFIGAMMDAIDPLTNVAGALTAVADAASSLWKATQPLRKEIAGVFSGLESDLKSWLAFFLGMISKVLDAVDSMVRVGEKIPIFGKKFRGLHDDIDAAKNKIDEWRSSLSKTDGQHSRTGKSLGALATSAEDASSRAHDALKGLTDDLNTTLKGVGAKPVHFNLAKPFTGGRNNAASMISGGVTGLYRGGPVGGHSTADDHIVVDLKTGRPKAMISGTEGILTRDQMHEVNGAMAFSSLFGMTNYSDLHSLWGGMTLPHHAQGGVLQRANSLDKMHLPYIWGGHHGDQGPIINPRPGLDCSSTVSYVLGIPPRVSGQFENFGKPGSGAITIFANPEHTFMSILGRGFGTSNENPRGGAGWLDYNSRPGFTVRHVDANWAGIGAVNTPKISGPAGALKSVAQGSVNKAAASANQYLSSILSSFDSGSGQPLKEFTGGWTSVLNQIAQARHWSARDWLQVVQMESSGNPNAVNRGSGATGLGQMLGGNIAKYNARGTPAQQIEGMGQYIKDRYGNPTRALAHEHAFHWYRTGGPLAQTASSKAAPKGSKVNLNNLTKWAGLPGIPNIAALDTVIQGLQSTYDQQNQFSTLIDGQITSTDLGPLIGIREKIVGYLQAEQSLTDPALTRVNVSLTERQRAEHTVAGRKAAVDKQIETLKRQAQKEARRMATLRHNRSSEVMTIADKLAKQTHDITGAEANNVDRINAVDGSYKSKLDDLRRQLNNVPKGTGRNNSNDRRRTAIRNQITAVEGRRTDALSGLKTSNEALRKQQEKLRQNVAAQRRKFSKRGFDDAWAYQIRRWKVQDQLAALQKKSKALGASDKTILKQEAQLTGAQAALQQREDSLPTSINQAILDTLGLQSQAGVPLGGFGGLAVGDLAGISETLGLVVPTGTGGAQVGGGTAGGGGTGTSLTADQQAAVDQATQLKQILASGNFINSAALSVLGPAGSGGNPNAIGSVGAPSSNPLAGMGSAASGPLAAQTGALQVIFQSYVPPTPQQAKELGNHVVSGISYQGLVASPRTVI